MTKTVAHKKGFMSLRIALLLFAFIVIHAAAQAAVYPMPPQGNDLIGETIVIYAQKGDTANKLMRKYEISYHELLEANPQIKFSNLHKGTLITIPTQFILPQYRKGIVINIPELRLYYFTPDGQSVFTTTVGLGRSGWRTPPMTTYVIKKEENPTWHVPKKIASYALEKNGRILPEEIPPGPDNPLGNYALYLSYNGYLIHGTNDPESVGKYASSGCMRLSADAISRLFTEANVGTIVHIVHDANKSGWSNSVLYLESHVPVSSNLHDEQKKMAPSGPEIAINQAITGRSVVIDWPKVSQVAMRQTGIPEPISR